MAVACRHLPPPRDAKIKFFWHLAIFFPSREFVGCWCTHSVLPFFERRFGKFAYLKFIVIIIMCKYLPSLYFIDFF